MASTRQLAAIMFTDIVGYTALMGEDEQRAFELLNKNRALHQNSIEQNSGRWIKELGDGVLASFMTVTDAVNCACSIIKECEQVNGLELRIGIHLGEVVFENNDVFGDGVNIASRLQALAPIGGIWVSEAVYNNVSNKKGIDVRFVKDERLKHVKEPVGIYEVKTANTNETAPAPFAAKQIPKPDPEKSIAVLPFVNMSNDPEQEYFSDGMAEEILNCLSHIKDLKIAGRTSSFQFKGKNIDLREVGQKLNVCNVLEGSVRKQGNRLRITAQLIKVEDGFHLWSERYDREMDDIFAVQDEIAASIAEHLKVTLLDRERAIISKAPTEVNEAYELYLKGRYNWNKRGEYIKKGLGYFQHAIQLDPNFALAYAGIAASYAIIAFYGILPPHDTMPKAKQAAEKAISLNASLVEAHTVLAFVIAFYDWNWPEARKRFLKACVINPAYAPMHYWFSLYLAWIENDFEEAIREAKKSVDHEPLVAMSHNYLAVAYLHAGKFKEALHANEMALELDPHASMSQRYWGLSLAGLGRYDEAIDALKTALDLFSRHPWILVDLIWVYSLANKPSEIETISDEMLERSKTEYIPGLFLCAACYFAKKFDKALEFIEIAFEQRDATLPSFNAWPVMITMKNDPMFRECIDRLQFPVVKGVG